MVSVISQGFIAQIYFDDNMKMDILLNYIKCSPYVKLITSDGGGEFFKPSITIFSKYEDKIEDCVKVLNDCIDKENYV